MKTPIVCAIRIAAFLALAGFGVIAGAGRSNAAEPTPRQFTCPDSLELDPRPTPDRDPRRVREIAPSAGAHTSQELYTHGRLATVAYELYGAFTSGKDPRSVFAVPGLQLVSLIYGDPGPDTERRPPNAKDTTTLYGFIADEAATGRRYIVFRGTEQPLEWVRNIQAGQRPYPSGTKERDARAHVHAGFFKIFESLRLAPARNAAGLASSLPGLVRGRETIFVGHSLGSALATLAGVEASRLSPEVGPRLRIVTLASPRVGDEGFASLARGVGRIDRVCNLVDIVTAVPPSTRFIHYVHVGTPFRVSSFDWPNLSNSLDKAGDQILCWHGDQSYTAMLWPQSAQGKTGQCYK